MAMGTVSHGHQSHQNPTHNMCNDGLPPGGQSHPNQQTWTSILACLPESMIQVLQRWKRIHKLKQVCRCTYNAHQWKRQLHMIGPPLVLSVIPSCPQKQCKGHQSSRRMKSKASVNLRPSLSTCPPGTSLYKLSTPCAASLDAMSPQTDSTLEKALFLPFDSLSPSKMAAFLRLVHTLCAVIYPSNPGYHNDGDTAASASKASHSCTAQMAKRPAIDVPAMIRACPPAPQREVASGSITWTMDSRNNEASPANGKAPLNTAGAAQGLSKLFH